MSEIAYEQFLKNKVIIAEDFGFDVEESALNVFGLGEGGDFNHKNLIER